MTENEISYKIRGAIYTVFSELGPGLFESVYEACLVVELRQAGLDVKQQIPLPVYYKDEKIGLGFRLDLIVENKVIIEIKSIESLAKVHYKQLLTYLKLSNMKLGILVNFNVDDINSGTFRVVNNL